MTTQTVDNTVTPEARAAAGNEIGRLRRRVVQGRITRFWPLALIFLRFPLILAGNGLVYAYTVLFLDLPNPWQHALLWSNVHTSLIADTVTIGLVVWLVRREGLRLTDLMNLRRGRLVREILIGLGLFFILYLTLTIGNLLGTFVAFGPAAFAMDNAAFDALTKADLPPLWFYLWGLLILPVTVALAEELAYRGYAQPRLEALTGSKWAAVLIVALGFGVQHIAFALTDWQSALARFTGAFVAGLVFGVIYLKQRRLLPLIIGHWLVDVVGLGLFPLLTYLSL